MKRLLIFTLLLAVAAPASALDRWPWAKNKKKKKTQTEQTQILTPDSLRTVCPEPVEEAGPEPVEPPVNDITLGLTAEQADSLLAEWRERQRQDAYIQHIETILYFAHGRRPERRERTKSAQEHT